MWQITNPLIFFRCYSKILSSDGEENNVLTWHDLAACYLSHARDVTSDPNRSKVFGDRALAVARHCASTNANNWQHWNLLGNVAFFQGIYYATKAKPNLNLNSDYRRLRAGAAQLHQSCHGGERKYGGRLVQSGRPLSEARRTQAGQSGFLAGAAGEPRLCRQLDWTGLLVFFFIASNLTSRRRL